MKNWDCKTQKKTNQKQGTFISAIDGYCLIRNAAIKGFSGLNTSFVFLSNKQTKTFQFHATSQVWKKCAVRKRLIDTRATMLFLFSWCEIQICRCFFFVFLENIDIIETNIKFNETQIPMKMTMCSNILECG